MSDEVHVEANTSPIVVEVTVQPPSVSHTTVVPPEAPPAVQVVLGEPGPMPEVPPQVTFFGPEPPDTDVDEYLWIDTSTEPPTFWTSAGPA